MKNEKLVNDKIKCSGCGLCAIKCPKKAISMKEDDAGFIYPYIDKTKCINCGLCNKICEYCKESKFNHDICNSYVAISKDKSILNTTASGGAFTSIAKDFVESGGVVYGAAINKCQDSFKVNHIRVDTIEGLELIKGSKYLQSNLYDVYESIKRDSNSKKKILFSGTPCQVAAIKKYIGDYDELYTIDIICHGVPNNKMFNDYIHSFNKKNNVKIIDFKFRDKSKGWGSYFYNYSFYDKDKKILKNKCEAAFNSSYYQLFLDSYIFRINCYSCPYACIERVGDITIGDFWGIEEEHNDFLKNDNINVSEGVSCILVNSKKGQKIINKMNDKMIFYDTSVEQIKKHNMQLNHPCTLKPEREKLLKEYVSNGYESIEKFYNAKYGKKRLIKNIWYKLPKRIRKLIKK